MEIKTKSGNILVVEITSEEDLMFDNIEARIISQLDNVKIIGKLSELKDEDIEEFVEFKKVKGQFSDLYYYKDYPTNTFTHGTSSNSFLSLLTSNGLNTNKEFLIVKTL